VAAKKRRSLISGTPRSVARMGDAPDDSTDERSYSEGSEHTDRSEGGSNTISDRTDRFPEMSRTSQTDLATEEVAEAPVSAELAAAAAAQHRVTPELPGALDDRDAWFLRTGQPAPRREATSLDGATVATGPGAAAWVAALGMAVAIALAVVVVVWMFAG
jgi:hypothetical protein